VIRNSTACRPPYFVDLDSIEGGHNGLIMELWKAASFGKKLTDNQVIFLYLN
jgi:hypothetical protein